MSIDRFNHKVDRKVETKPARLQRIEVITGVERRRAWSREEKRAILTESFEDGVVISEVARRYGLRPQQLFAWRNEFRKRGLARFQSNCPTIEPPAFAPVMIARSGQEAEARIEPPAPAAPDASVLVVEGEKATKAAETRFPDYVVVSWPGGSASAGKADWQVLAKRHVILWPDADEPGQKAMQEVAKALLAAGSKSIRKVELPSWLPKGWDLADEAPEGLDVANAIKSAGDCDPTLGQYFLTAKQLLALLIPKQEFLIEPFMPTRSLSMVYAERGLGKTWLCMTLSLALAKGEPFFHYKVPKARRVLFVDGEMALNELQWRLRALDPNPPETLEFLPSELLYQRDVPLNLHEEEDQKRLLAALTRREALDQAPELIVIDNLSSLARGVDENSNSDLDKLLLFLLGLRHRGYSVLLVHHAGKNKEQRGASRREDLLNLSIELRRPDKSTDKKCRDESTLPPHDGAHFILKFSKVRGRAPKPPMLDLKLREADGRVEWLIDDAPNATPEDKVLRYIAERSPQTQKQIAEDFNVTPGYISQICSLLGKKEYIKKATGKGPSITQKGCARLAELWPELAGQIHWQDEFDKIL